VEAISLNGQNILFAGARCLWWLGSAREERWQWSGGAAEGTGKEVGGAPGVDAELGVVMESS
jgi:hypothetical protein